MGKTSVDKCTKIKSSTRSIVSIFRMKKRKALYLYRPCLCVRIQESVMSVVIVKYGSHKSSMYVSPKVCCIVLLKSLPENIEVIG